ncbi:helix-turn-helix transcriptional regulator [Brevibacillus sp. MER 51]|uniref:helix-turn-helix domain-containing protein n=1 Tax=Brevibacillus sp. MER 51 TaxID=2939560 RepID=UPI00203C1BD1|nr:helix-turn-helix transcriptional regulator [Brevibacillus sp. MER 51]MCM3144314.1 helix-turn-helix transcriptional regulator [Brevibacillus sp. MER 51]
MTVTVGKCLLKDRLKDAKMTQAELASILNKKPQRISDYANNARFMSPLTMKAIATVLKCHMDDLYEWIITP